MHDADTYCSVCGTRLVIEQIEGRDRRYCPDCERIQYRNPKSCAGTLIVDEDRLLLVKRTEPPGVGTWSVPAGYLEYNEPPRTAAVRELSEETAVEVSEDELELLDSVFVQHPDGQYVLVLVYIALVEQADGEPEAGDDAGDARFWSLPELRNREEEIEIGYEKVFEAAIRRITQLNESPRSA